MKKKSVIHYVALMCTNILATSSNNPKNRKRNLSAVFATIAAAFSVVSCQHIELIDNTPDLVKVNLRVGFDTTTETVPIQEPMQAPTRAAVTGASRLVIKVFDASNQPVTLTLADGTTATDIKQSAGDTGFGTFTGIRLTPGTYKFVCVGHKCGSATTGHATITSPTMVTLPDPGVYTTYSLVKEVTIAPSATMQQDIEMQLATSYSMVSLVTKDNVTPGAAKVRLTINPDGTETDTYTLNPTTHLTPDADIKTVVTLSLSDKVGKTVNIDQKFLLPASPQHYTLVAEILDADDQVLNTRTYTKDQDGNNILYYLGRKTVIRTNLFTTTGTTTITLEDWGTDNVYDIE